MTDMIRTPDGDLIVRTRGTEEVAARGVDPYRDCVFGVSFPGTIVEDGTPGISVWVEYVDGRGHIQTEITTHFYIESLRFPTTRAEVER